MEYTNKYLNLWKIKFPITAIVSILHRISGFLMSFLLPILLYVIFFSLSSNDNFLYIKKLFSSGMAKFIMQLVLIPMIYHFYAGIRHLLMDMGYCESFLASRYSAKIVLASTMLTVIAIGVRLWAY